MAAKKSSRKSTTKAAKKGAKKTARKSPARKTGRKPALKKSGGRKFGKKASKKIGRVMHEFAHGELKSGKGEAGGKVTSREQAIAIGISEARAEGDKVPKQQSRAPKGGRKKAASSSS